MKEAKLTQEQRATLAPHERHLHSAVYADYVVALSTTAATDLFNVYNAVFAANEVNKHCSACVLRVCKKLGTLYFADEQPEAANEPPTNTTPKKRAPRGSKNKK